MVCKRPPRERSERGVAHTPSRFPRLDNLSLPPASRKHPRADECQCRKRDCGGPEHTVWPQPGIVRKHIGQRKFPTPEATEIDPCRRPRIARTVQCIREDHTVGVEEESIADSPKTRGCIRCHLNVGC